MRVSTILGARPQFIKAAVVSKKIREKNKEIIIHTGQHYDDNMSKIFFDELEIPKPDYNLNIGSGYHGFQTGNMLIKIEDILLKEKPDIVLVYGDTNSTIAGALAASKLLIPIAHIEAGLRSFNKNMPEEQNRILTDHISDYLFAPTETSEINLKKEGISRNVFKIGDVMYDGILHFSKLASVKSMIISRLNIRDKYILATIHRAENTNDISKLKNIVQALNESGKRIILPLHPRTQKYISQYNLKISSNVSIIHPIGYLDMLMLEKNAEKILTDSGGVQKEAFFLGKPCITLREETEWIETVNNGWNILVGSNAKKIIQSINEFLPQKERKNYFGNGDAADKIVNILNKGLFINK
ncbi:UDP-N-acetylglucosamine 2-epimerase (non-hydrolyzing) [Clostridium fermenticellae]|uniref:UDP-N-acetylglucosamine 2-epimerase (Non-hydrolyzing) n=1 Tax=Clostridium fermenticellae TaxID=2068654 RepID=A0A386H116_9CLOT|nr:UDP-N-acetylglucosamine 2-epimerase (non-hydrolyzing) [Clostridium fermenticellae]AYD39336.1 UDP-N-acetylglucosamine 2-epimerase (non-hydrolyzing) [Clostridium fermenticellae]